jgi:hypothetical protein
LVTKSGFVPTKWSKLCSNHFLHTDYQKPTGGSYYLKLKNNAVPLLPSSSQPPVKIHKFAKETASDSSLTDENPDNKLTEEIHPILITPTKAKPIHVTPTKKRKSTEIITPVRKMKGKIKVLQQKIRRQQFKIKNMMELFKKLRSKGLLDSEVKIMMVNKFDGIF